MAIYKTSNKVKLYLGTTKVKKVYLGTTKIYSSGNIVTYIMDGKVYHTQEFEEGQSVLSPSKSPSKSGYIFLGWSLSTSGNVLTSLTMGDQPITLYAQFVQTAAWNFSYNGSVQSFVVPVTGLYKLTAYGAKGGKNNAGYGHAQGNGGLGGTSVGYKYFAQGTRIYVVVGGVGGDGKTSSSGYLGNGGYNGGGSGSGVNAGGGGATHFALNQGTVLSSTTQSNVLMVAGGGGGGGYWWQDGCDGGTGGGSTGGNGVKTGDLSAPTGGSQTVGGKSSVTDGGDGAYGVGGTAPILGGSGSHNGTGGGGGLYGGGAGHEYNSSSNCSSGAGGSGYIGGVPQVTYKGKTYTPSTTNGGCNGNGSASIQFIAT